MGRMNVSGREALGSCGRGTEALSVNMTRVVEASVYLSRKCDDGCRYCNLSGSTKRKDLLVEEWKDIMDILGRIGVKSVNLLCGDPASIGGIGGLIRHLNEKTSLDYSVTSNFKMSEASLTEMADAGIKSYTAGVSVFGSSGDGDAGFVMASSAGMIMIERMKALGVKRLCANLTMSRKNIGGIVGAVRYLSNRGIWTDITVAHGGLDTKETSMLIDVSAGLLELKRNGGLIASSEEYLAGMAICGAGFSWKCCETHLDVPSRIVVDADGLLMMCTGRHGHATADHNIFELVDADLYALFVQDWQHDAETCMGCYKSAMVMAREKQDIPENMVA